ncbi:MAG: ABC transporter ATP-binding protein [Candidatus Aureabacteria bacterium]|nr:ABC transporter ATP-binding protein [Candidatus Auribacterota bacterium]
MNRNGDLIEAEGLCKIYHTEGEDVHALRDVSISVARGEFLSIVGPSGCGKSTLLYVLGGLTTATSGSVRIDGQNLIGLSDTALSRVRAGTTGFVFQRFNLFPTLTVRQNIVLAQEISRSGARDMLNADEILSRVGLRGKERRRPSELSMGEQQRAAIARALAHCPAILLADEPTGNLDSANSEAIVALFREMHRDLRQTILLVTHNREVAEAAERIVQMRDGRIVHNS